MERFARLYYVFGAVCASMKQLPDSWNPVCWLLGAHDGRSRLSIGVMPMFAVLEASGGQYVGLPFAGVGVCDASSDPAAGT